MILRELTAAGCAIARFEVDANHGIAAVVERVLRVSHWRRFMGSLGLEKGGGLTPRLPDWTPRSIKTRHGARNAGDSKPLQS